MVNKIELQFKKSTTRLAGNPYGRSVFNEQVKDKIDYQNMNVIVFPANIEKVASSFVQGFFSEIIVKVGYKGFEEIITIEAENNSELKDEMVRDLYS